MDWSRQPGSFRDPSGFVFVADGVVYRQVNQPFGAQFAHLIDSGLYAELASNELLVAHEEVTLRLPDSPPAHVVIRPEAIPFISYPYEWCFSQLKAAALLTLDIQKRALKRGMSLRDASAFNVQFIGARPVFIDTLSLGFYREGEPWHAYRQFCSHFIAPLALMSMVDPGLLQLSRVHIDGVPLDLARRLLPVRSRLRPGLLMHLHLHGGRSPTTRDQHTCQPPADRSRRMGKTAMLGLIDSLERTIQKLNWTPPQTLWSTYTDHSTYTADAQNHKQLLVERFMNRVRSESALSVVWDVGANTGVYSRIASSLARTVVSFDLDPAAVEMHFRTCLDDKVRGVLPLVQDLTNPSGGAGWRNRERTSLEARGPADTVLGLALIHHLVFGGNVPLREVAEFFAAVGRHLIIEFVPGEDSQVQRMTALRSDGVHRYSQQLFEEVFRTRFRILEAAVIEGTVRTLYLMRRHGSEEAAGVCDAQLPGLPNRASTRRAQPRRE